jgi:hypothetical protein
LLNVRCREAAKEIDVARQHRIGNENGITLLVLREQTLAGHQKCLWLNRIELPARRTLPEDGVKRFFLQPDCRDTLGGELLVEQG